MTFGFGTIAQADFMEDLVSMTHDGIRRDAALEEMSKILSGRASIVARGLRSTLSQGRMLADGMAGTFDPILVDAARAGEKGGRFEEAVASGVELLRQRAQAVGQLIKSLGYPLFVFTMVMSLTLFLVVSVIPEFSSLVPKHKLTAMGKLVVGIGDYIRSYGIVTLIIIAGAIYAVTWSLPNLTGNIRASLDAFPPWRFYRAYQSATFMQNLSLLLRSGVMFRDALALLSRHASPYVASHIRMMLRRLASPDAGRTGMSINALALETGLILDADVRRLRLITQGAAFEESLFRLGKRTSKQVSELLSVIERFLTVTALLVSGGFLTIAGLGLFQTIAKVGA